MPKSSGKRAFYTLLLLIILIIVRQATSVTTSEKFNLVGALDFRLSPMDGQLVSLNFVPVGGLNHKTIVSIETRCRSHQDLRGLPNNSSLFDLNDQATVNQRIRTLLSSSTTCFDNGGGGDTFIIRPSHDVDLYVTYNTSGSHTALWFIAALLVLVHQAFTFRKL